MRREQNSDFLYDLMLTDEEIEHIRAIKAHRYAARKYKKEANCRLCGTSHNIQAAHLFPVSPFALLLEPSEMVIWSLCEPHHKQLEYIQRLYIEGWNWRIADSYKYMEQSTKIFVLSTMTQMENKFFEIMGKHPIDCYPIRTQTGGKMRVIFLKPTTTT